MARFIEIPVLLIDEDGIDYEGLGINPPDAEPEEVYALLNTSLIERVNPADQEDHKTAIWMSGKEGPYQTRLEYEEVKRLIADA